MVVIYSRFSKSKGNYKMVRTCSLIPLPSPFYSFILSFVAFGMKLNGSIKALK